MADSDIHRNLYDASWIGEDTRVRELLAAGAEPDKYKTSYGETALSEAATYGRDSTVSILIQHGADINRQNYSGNTALHWAAARGHNNVTATLVMAGAELNIQNNDGNTALHMAAGGGYKNVTATLVKAGADLNIQNNDGKIANHDMIARLE